MAVEALRTAVRQIRSRLMSADDSEPTDRELLRRFIDNHNEAAFTTLVERHQRLVHGALAKVLSDAADVEDAFQATFLVLVRKATSVNWHADLGTWLYAVAHRIAVHARSDAQRRIRREEAARRTETGSAATDMSWREACGLLHQELDKLPDKFRLPLMLCYLEGKSRDEAAAQLGVSVGSVKGRLERGRVMLRDRLARRGVTLSAGLLGAVACSPAIALPAHLADRVLSAASGAVSARVAMMARGASAATVLGYSKWFVGAMLIAVALGSLPVANPARPVAASTLPVAVADEKPPAAEPEQLTKPPRLVDNDADPVAVKGCVVDPNGRPVGGAKVTLFRHQTAEERHPVASIKTENDGRFEFRTDRGTLKWGMSVVAWGEGHGPAWVELGSSEKAADVTLCLVEDQAIAGQVLDLEGRCVPGARLRVLSIAAPKEENLADHFSQWEQGRARSHYLPESGLGKNVPVAIADADGRFSLKGLGRERIVTAVIEGPTIASIDVWILTRPAPIPKFYHATPVYPATFKHFAAPTKPVIGVVRDRATKKPLAGVVLRSDKLANLEYWGTHYVTTTTDADGKYRLVGLPKGEGSHIVVIPTADQPYMGASLRLGDSAGLDPLEVDFELNRGVRVEGRVVSKLTGKPLPRARVEYFALAGNLNLANVGPNGAFLFARQVLSADDGSYRLIALPGPGIVAVQSGSNYLLASEQAEWAKESYIPTAPHSLHPRQYNALARIEPSGDAKAIKADIALKSGETLRGKLVDPDGKPLPNAWVFAQSGWGGWKGPLKDDAFVLNAFNRLHPRKVFFIHPEKNLAAALTLPKDEKAEVIVKLEPAGAVTGRLVDLDGKPRPAVRLEVYFLPDTRASELTAHQPLDVLTDAEGRFRVPCVLPGFIYLIGDGKDRQISGNPMLKKAETKDLGDVRLVNFN
jgi:RNA polymerase sigma factor (sigma-70 family)